MLSVSACAGTQKIELDVRPKADLPRPPDKAALPPPRAINERPFKFVVVKLPSGKVYIALTPDQYAIYEANRAEVLRWVREAKYQINYYRKPVEPPAENDKPNAAKPAENKP